MLRKAKIAVLVSGSGTNLQALIAAQEAKEIKSGEITLAISSDPGAYALTRAVQAGLKTAVADRKALGREAFERRLLELLEAEKPDLIILAGFMYILSADFISRVCAPIINVHPSLIPAFCGEGFYGLKVHEAALERGVKVTGATVHFVNEIPDGGKIILQKAVNVRQSDTPKALQRRVKEQAEWVILPKAAELVCREIIASKEE